MQASRVQASTADLLDPASATWEGVASHVLSLEPAPVEYQVTKYIRNAWKDRRYGVVESASIQAATNGEVIAIRLEWPDSEHPDTEFPDACALAFALSDSTSLETFGDPNDPINLWLWRSDSPGDAEDALARTMRDISPRGNGSLEAAALFSKDRDASGDGRWTVVFSRPLGESEGGASIGPGLQTRFAVLVWEGANEERAGLAAMTPDWEVLEIEE